MQKIRIRREKFLSYAAVRQNSARTLQHKPMRIMEKTTLMQHIRTAASKLNGCKLTRLTPAATSLDAICGTLGLSSREEAMALVAILDRQCNGRSTDLDDLSTYFQCSALDVMSLMPALNALTAKGYVTLENRSERLLSRKQFTLCTDIFYALIEGREVRPVAPCENLQLEYVRKLRDCVIDREDRLVFYAICYELIDDDQYGIDQLNEIYEKSGAIKKRKEFKQEQHMLQKRGLVEVATAGFFNETVLRLTEKGKELFLGEDVELFEKKTTDKDLIQPEKIAERHLFFSETLDRQLATLRRSLDEANYANLRARLEERHLPTGVAALLYGLPGTGKTESVMQMARATGRAVMHVDISATKSCWFGESEKLIKEVFTKYRSLCEKKTKTPILLFNEADAVFSKRKDATASNVAQTENAIQNIILEEMEKLDGILIATTNLADNLDKAFERRFLFKIRFDRPTLEAKASIWRDKLPALTDTEAAELASRFDLSGGEIDNVVRKVLMEEVVSGETPSLAMATRIASEERINKETRKIGFTC